MCTLRTGGAWYVPDFARSSRRWRLPSKSRSYSSAVNPSTPTAPSLRVRRYASFSQSMSIKQASEVNAICGDCFANTAIRSCFVDTMVEFRCIRRVSQEGSMIRRLASLPGLRSGTVRPFRRYYQGAMTSSRPSRRTSLPSLGGTSTFTRSVRSPADEWAAEAWSWSPGIPNRDIAEDDRNSQVPGEPRLSVCPGQSTPAGLRTPDRYSAAAWPLVSEKQRLPRKVFRRSIAWRSDSLSTLRRAGYPASTQDSLPAVGQTLLDGISPARFQRKVSESIVTSHLSSP